MSTILRTAEFLCLSLWLGSGVFLSFVVAPGAFSMLGSRDQAGAMVGFALSRLHFIGIVCGFVFLIVRWLRTRAFSSFVAPVALAVVLMIALTAASQFKVIPRMAELRTQMGSIQNTPVESPPRVEFDRLHRLSVGLETGVLLAGLAALYLLVRESSAVPPQ